MSAALRSRPRLPPAAGEFQSGRHSLHAAPVARRRPVQPRADQRPRSRRGMPVPARGEPDETWRAVRCFRQQPGKQGRPRWSRPRWTPAAAGTSARRRSRRAAARPPRRADDDPQGGAPTASTACTFTPPARIPAETTLSAISEVALAIVHVVAAQRHSAPPSGLTRSALTIHISGDLGACVVHALCMERRRTNPRKFASRAAPAAYPSRPSLARS